MKKKGLSLFALFAGILCISSLSSCDETKLENNENKVEDKITSDTHKFNETYEYDETNHWHNCDSCDLVNHVEKHSFDENGTCTVCGYKNEKQKQVDENNIKEVLLYDHIQSNSRETKLAQRLFNKNDLFNTTNIALKVIKSENRKEKTELLNIADAEIETPDMSTEGVKEVKIKYASKEVSYTITVLDLSNVDKENAKVIVDLNATPSVKDNTITVNRINDAVMVFKLLGTSKNATKEIKVKEGKYFEKVEFDLPNIKLIGEGSDSSKTIIEYNLFAQRFAPNSLTTEYSTDGSSSVSIRKDAVGFYANNITFQNYWNTNDRYNESKLLSTENGGNGHTQAVACLVQADKCVFENVRFSGYHDTLYSQIGRHIYKDCYIEGRTDYIFGTTATSYFLNCTLKTIGANDNKNGGYLIATMGSDNSGNNKIEYGYIFNNCKMEADERVKDSTVSLARAWHDNMRLAFLNCDISSSYSLSAFGNKVDGKNERYTSMNKNPNAALLFEYNNTGAGALTNTTPGLIENTCTILNNEEAASFTDYKVIFAKQNGELKYDSDWDGSIGTIVPQNYNFEGLAERKMEESDPEGDSLFNGDIIIKGKYRLESTKALMQVEVGTVIEFTKAGTVNVSWFGSGYGKEENAKITYKNGMATIKIVDLAGQTGIYLKGITLDGRQPGVHEHEYSEFDIVKPTIDLEGSATKTCLDCELDEAYTKNITLPKLNKDDYTITASQNEGMAIYTYEIDGDIISFEAEILNDIHVHTYSDWNVLDTDIPSFENEGKMTRSCTDSNCNNDLNSKEEKVLPKLDDERYVITNNTATLTTKGTGTYTITIDGVTISFVAETNELEATINYSFTTLEEGNHSGTIDNPDSLYNGDILIVGSYRASSVGSQVNKGTIIYLNQAGVATIDWFGGDYGTEEDAEITYKDGKAIITIVGSGVKGAYIKNISVDRTDIPDDSNTYTITLKDKDNNVLGSLDVIEGKKITLSDIENVIDAIYDVENVYTDSDLSLEYSFDSSISSTFDLFLKLKATTDPIKFNFADYEANAKPDAFFNGHVIINSTSYWLNGQAIRLSVGDTITFDIKGAITIEWFGSVYGSEANGEIRYKDNLATITIVEDSQSTNGIYIKKITIDSTKTGKDSVKEELKVIEENYTYTYQIGERSQGDLEESTEYMEFSGCSVLNANWLYFKNNNYIKFNVKENATIKIKGIYSGWTEALNINGNDVALDGTEVTYLSTTGGEIIIKAPQSKQGTLGVIEITYPNE